MRFSVPDVFRALADRHRLKVLELLRRGPRTAGEIAGSFRMTQPAVSHHLAVLRRAGCVVAEKRGKEVFYSLNGCCLEECCGDLFVRVGLKPTRNGARRKDATSPQSARR